MAITQPGNWQGIAAFDRIRSGAIIRSGDRSSGSEQHWRAAIENGSVTKGKASNRCLGTLSGETLTFTGAQLNSGGPITVLEWPVRTAVGANGDLVIVYAADYTQAGASSAQGRITIEIDDETTTDSTNIAISGSVSVTSTTWTPASTWAADTDLIVRFIFDHTGTHDAADTFEIFNLAVFEDELTAGELPT